MTDKYRYVCLVGGKANPHGRTVSVRASSPDVARRRAALLACNLGMPLDAEDVVLYRRYRDGR